MQKYIHGIENSQLNRYMYVDPIIEEGQGQNIVEVRPPVLSATKQYSLQSSS
jgi:hypothetical protein